MGKEGRKLLLTSLLLIPSLKQLDKKGFGGPITQLLLHNEMGSGLYPQYLGVFCKDELHKNF